MDQSPAHHGQEEGNSSSSSAKSSFLCRQSSTRWIPTSDQVRILKDLYYNSGIRSPSAEQIQRISARLRQYGKIEGKNVFYWFQNHKARERQKKRLTADLPMQKGAAWKPDDHSVLHKYTTTHHVPTGFVPSSPSSSSSPGHVLGWPPAFMEKSFRDCSISGGYMGNNWVGALDSSPVTGSRKYVVEVPPVDVETLQLFPMHKEEESNNDDAGGGGDFCGTRKPAQAPAPYFHGGSWFANEVGDETTTAATLELSLGGPHRST
ncbi:hypothetical protein H6P81_018859 [Aristolochia fimbriata]|uniref:Homeobox domain-containing protein n=1 Tax=Aristolochia fimbriata TaxID=158543 RepID=A0AAV7E4F6_ARIFI|nr:hypothetical protein H6P81_018859 [Aristolochia fimbriata]